MDQRRGEGHSGAYRDGTFTRWKGAARLGFVGRLHGFLGFAVSTHHESIITEGASPFLIGRAPHEYVC